MKLWLRFKDENDEEQRLPIEGDEFIIGRHSGSDLSIPNGKLSREHLKIQPFAGAFVATDLGSSNGTTRNDEKMTDPVTLRNGDRLDLGGGLEIEVELTDDEGNPLPKPGGSGDEPASAPEAEADEDAAVASASGTGTGPAGASSASASDGAGGIPTSLFYIAPALGLLILIFLGGIIFLARSGDQKGSNNVEIADSTPIDRDTPIGNNDSKNGSGTKTGQNSIDPPSNNGTTTDPDPVDRPPSPANVPDTTKCEDAAKKFLRQIAVHDPTAFLTGTQAQIVNDKVKQMSSSAVADNINSARRSSSQIRSLASGKNLKPQFLAVAALAKLGTSKGDVVQAAKDMADALDKLQIPIGGELANDSLLMIAAYDRVGSGEYQKMPSMLQDLATKSPEGARGVRTIWFLQKNGKITDGEYNFALQFLALGVITQNPKDFGVNAEALVL